ncbi:TenA family protein [Microlunatus panaciterrae]|uniref:Aminopyrimidine aminohydrolase n=1 Tax=Microlunatus panaciterrae TaxID=400768 RepID=A0ABS2RJU6_9ACTN|nr:TenA family protein [Microlunatus panaciterrae]MBM7798229.1 thiaminase/transcriptional activator TenA [Microlunatus panaciterrae]
MSFVDQLRQAAEPDWTAAVDHRFVAELFDGRLSDARLARYLIQDYQFCDAFVALLGQAVASAPDLGSRLIHAGQLGAFASDENTYFTDAFDALRVPIADRTSPQLEPVTEQFNALLLKARDSRSYPQVLTVLLVAEWLYRDWAAADRPLPARPEHRGWIEVHNTPDFTRWVDWLQQELNRKAPAEAEARAELMRLFVEATRLELAFFDAVYAD